MFVDMDYFYSACEEIRHPETKGKPMIVGTGDKENKLKGVVESCNYEARKFGIRSAMPVAQALKLKSDVIYMPADHDYYDVLSKRVMEILKGLGYKMEVMSIDEAAIDLDNMSSSDAMKLGAKAQNDIQANIGLPCTVGIADGKVLAKIVCDAAKPNGLMLVERKNMKAFLSEKNTDNILGVGYKTAEKLKTIGIKTIGDLAKADILRLSDLVGSFGVELHQIANGIDESRIIEQYEILSIGRERTIDATNELVKIDAMIDELSKEVVTEVIKNGFRFKTITIKTRYNDFTERIKSKTLRYYTDSFNILKDTAKSLIREQINEKLIRKVGVRTSSFEKGKMQKSLR